MVKVAFIVSLLFIHPISAQESNEVQPRDLSKAEQRLRENSLERVRALKKEYDAVLDRYQRLSIDFQMLEIEVRSRIKTVGFRGLPARMRNDYFQAAKELDDLATRLGVISDEIDKITIPVLEVVEGELANAEAVVLREHHNRVKTKVDQDGYPYCDALTPRQVQDRLTCVGANGSYFTRIEGNRSGWLDEASRLLWTDPISPTVDLYQAQAFCLKRHERLPTIREYKDARDRGIYLIRSLGIIDKVGPWPWKNSREYWSSTRDRSYDPSTVQLYYTYPNWNFPPSTLATTDEFQHHARCVLEMK